MYNGRVLKTGQDSYTNDSTIDIGLSGMIPAQLRRADILRAQIRLTKLYRFNLDAAAV